MGLDDVGHLSRYPMSVPAARALEEAAEVVMLQPRCRFVNGQAIYSNGWLRDGFHHLIAARL
jgi:hypothetical protein